MNRVLILGSGPAGLTAAIYAARANLKPLVLTGNEPGGQLTITTDVENYPGYPQGVQGPQMMEDLRTQAERFGAVIKTGSVKQLHLGRDFFEVQCEDASTHATEALIVASGASARWLGLDSETKLRNRGVSACATCDGFFFRGKPLAVVGGGDTAMEEALFLANLASRVYVVHRRDSLRASQVMQGRALKHPNIRFVWNCVVDEVLGDPAKKGVEGLRLRNVQDNAQSTLAVEGLFVAIGHVPNTAAFGGALALDAEGYIKVNPGGTHTSIEGVFACGDVVDKVYRQAITAAGTGCMAAMDAERWLSGQKTKL